MRRRVRTGDQHDGDRSANTPVLACGKKSRRQRRERLVRGKLRGCRGLAGGEGGGGEERIDWTRAVNLVIEGSFCYRFNRITLSNRSKIRRNCDARRSPSWNFTLAERRTVGVVLRLRASRSTPRSGTLCPPSSSVVRRATRCDAARRGVRCSPTTLLLLLVRPPSRASDAANHFYTRSPFGAVRNSSRRVQPPVYIANSGCFEASGDHSLRAFTGLNHKIVPERSPEFHWFTRMVGGGLVRWRVHSTRSAPASGIRCVSIRSRWPV